MKVNLAKKIPKVTFTLMQTLCMYRVSLKSQRQSSLLILSSTNIQIACYELHTILTSVELKVN